MANHEKNTNYIDRSWYEKTLNRYYATEQNEQTQKTKQEKVQTTNYSTLMTSTVSRDALEAPTISHKILFVIVGERASSDSVVEEAVPAA